MKLCSIDTIIILLGKIFLAWTPALAYKRTGRAGRAQDEQGCGSKSFFPLTIEKALLKKGGMASRRTDPPATTLAMLTIPPFFDRAFFILRGGV